MKINLILVLLSVCLFKANCFLNVTNNIDFKKQMNIIYSIALQYDDIINEMKEVNNFVADALGLKKNKKSDDEEEILIEEFEEETD